MKTVESTRPRAKNVGRSGGPLQRGAPCHGTIGTMVNPPLSMTSILPNHSVTRGVLCDSINLRFMYIAFYVR